MDAAEIVDTQNKLLEINDALFAIQMKMAEFPIEACAMKPYSGAMHSLGQAQQSLGNLLLKLSKSK